MKINLSSIIFGIAIIVSAIIFGNAYVNRTKTEGQIQVTGLGKTDFVSDLIVWEGQFFAMNKQLKGSYTTLERNKGIIKKYLVDKGVLESEIVFKAVNVNESTKGNYTPDGKYIGEEFIGYQLTQSLKIESTEVEKIEQVSREITELLNKGVRFYSEAPRYYYTKLTDLKIEMISQATEDARLRAEKISKFSGSELGKLESAKMGVFQITGQNSKEDYSWGGTFNTSSKAKTASITMKLVYNIK